MKEGYKVRAFRVKNPGSRWYEDCLNIDMEYFIAESIEEECEVLGMMDSFPRYWIQSKNVPQVVLDRHPELEGHQLAIRFEDSIVTSPDGLVRRYNEDHFEVPIGMWEVIDWPDREFNPAFVDCPMCGKSTMSWAKNNYDDKPEANATIYKCNIPECSHYIVYRKKDMITEDYTSGPSEGKGTLIDTLD